MIRGFQEGSIVDEEIETISFNVQENDIDIHVNENVTSSYFYLPVALLEEMLDEVKKLKMEHLLTDEMVDNTLWRRTNS